MLYSKDLSFRFVSLTINKGCNFCCPFCFFKNWLSSGHDIIEMDDNIFYNAWNSLLPYMEKDKNGNTKFNIAFFATEPSLSMHKVRKYTVWLRDKGCNRCYMTTNGYTLTHDDIIWLSNNKFHINISFEGNRVRQDTIRRVYDIDSKQCTSSYDRVLNNIIDMKSNKVNYQILYLIEPLAYKHAYDGIQSIIDNNILPVYINMAVDHVVWTDSILKDMEYELNKIASIVLDDPEYIKYIGPYNRTINKIYGTGHWRLFDYQDIGTCGAAKKGIAMDINGNIVICHRAMGYNDPIFRLNNDDGTINAEKVYWWRNRVSPMGNSIYPYSSSCWIINYEHTGDPFTISYEKYIKPNHTFYRGLIQPVINKMITDDYYEKRVREILNIRHKIPRSRFNSGNSNGNSNSKSK